MSLLLAGHPEADKVFTAGCDIGRRDEAPSPRGSVAEGRIVQVADVAVRSGICTAGHG